MTNLSDLQTILLSAASQRESGSLLPAPDNLSNVGARITKAVAALVKRGLAEERETGDAADVLRDEGDRLVGVFITDTGAEAIGIGELATDEPDIDDIATPPALAIDQAGDPKPPRQTKSAAVLALLERAEGATLAELIAATGWLPHTTRAALTGLRKKGHAIERGKRDGATCYTIASAT